MVKHPEFFFDKKRIKSKSNPFPIKEEIKSN